MSREIDLDEVLALISQGAVVLDAQGPGKFEYEHIPGAIRGRIDQPAATLAAIGDNLDQPIVVYCTDVSCTGSDLAATALDGCGYRNVMRYADGLAGWSAAGMLIVLAGPAEKLVETNEASTG